jgi:hypothetical protein
MKYTIPQIKKSIAGGASAAGIMAATLLADDAVRAAVPPGVIAALTLVAGLCPFLAVFFTKSEATVEQITRAAEDTPHVVVAGVTAATTGPQIAKAVVAVETAPPPDSDAEIADRVVDDVLREHGQDSH